MRALGSVLLSLAAVQAAEDALGLRGQHQNNQMGGRGEWVPGANSPLCSPLLPGASQVLCKHQQAPWRWGLYKYLQ